MMKHASAKVRKKVKSKFISAILRASQVEEQRERSMRMRRDRDRKKSNEESSGDKK